MNEFQLSHFHRCLRGLALTGIGAAFALLTLVRLDLIRTEKRLGIAAVVLLAACSNIYWWSWVYAVIRRVRARSTHRWFAFMAHGWNLYVMLMLLPVLLVATGHRTTREYLATPVVAWGMIWYLLVAGVGSVVFVRFAIRKGGLLVRKGLSWSSRHQRDPFPASSIERDAVPEPTAQPVCSRRGLLLGATAAAPLVITGSTFLTGRLQAGKFLVRKLNVQVPGLPERLRGFTITHVSDFHVGRIFRPEHLPAVVDAANALKSDLVAITGDIIDQSTDFLPAAVEALGQIQAPFGRYTVIGNHDLFRGASRTVVYLENHEPHFLNDELVSVDIGGESIQIAGLFWSRNETATPGDPGLTGRAAAAMANADRNRFTIALTHHPHAFEALAEQKANLVLAGHTHGGQIMLIPAESGYPLGAGNVLFRYIHGVYRHGDARLYVNSGVGNWFPVRINAPAEIVQLRLV